MWMQDCSNCLSAQTDGVQGWMRHLTEVHSLPTEWPSERVARLTGSAAAKPYTTITESKKRRRKDSIPRPLNSFMLFAQHIRRNVLRVFNEASNSVISQQLGNVWKTVPRSCKNRYDEEAIRLVKIHQLEFPFYKYQPKKRNQAPILTDQHSVVSPRTAKIAIAACAANRSTTPVHQRRPFCFTDSAYSSRKNSCTSSSASSPHIHEFSTPVKSGTTPPFRRVFFEEPEHQKPAVRQRFASAQSGSLANPRPTSCFGVKRVHCPQEFLYIAADPVDTSSIMSSPKRRPVSYAEASSQSLTELLDGTNEVTLGNSVSNWLQSDFPSSNSYFGSTEDGQESECGQDSILSDNGYFDDNLDAMMDTIDITTFLPGTLSADDEAAHDLFRNDFMDTLDVALTPDLDRLANRDLLRM